VVKHLDTFLYSHTRHVFKTTHSSRTSFELNRDRCASLLRWSWHYASRWQDCGKGGGG